MEKLRTKVLPISDTLREWRYRTHEPALHPYSFWDTAVRSEMGTEMKTAVFAALVLAIGSSAGQAGDLGPSHPADGVRFAAMSLTKDQGVRAIISNVLAPGNSAHLAPCQAQVSFFGADGSLIGNAMMVKLKAGESTSVVASQPSKLVRTIVSIGDAVDSAKACALRTSVEIFDLQTDTTFVSILGESIGSTSECSGPAAPALVVAPRNISGRKNSGPVATSPLPGATVSPKTRSPVLAATPSTAPR
jgi:hypothetical protein